MFSVKCRKSIFHSLPLYCLSVSNKVSLQGAELAHAHLLHDARRLDPKGSLIFLSVPFPVPWELMLPRMSVLEYKSRRQLHLGYQRSKTSTLRDAGDGNAVTWSLLGALGAD